AALGHDERNRGAEGSPPSADHLPAGGVICRGGEISQSSPARPGRIDVHPRAGGNPSRARAARRVEPDLRSGTALSAVDEQVEKAHELPGVAPRKGLLPVLDAAGIDVGRFEDRQPAVGKVRLAEPAKACAETLVSI